MNSYEGIDQLLLNNSNTNNNSNITNIDASKDVTLPNNIQNSIDINEINVNINQQAQNTNFIGNNDKNLKNTNLQIKKK